MKQMLAIVKPFRAQAALEAIGECGVDTVLVREAKGYGRQKDQLPRYLGSEYNAVYLPKIEITVLIDDARVAEVANKVAEIARTGRIGDGKMFLVPVVLEFDF